jgi:hypothetical protein
MRIQSRSGQALGRGRVDLDKMEEKIEYTRTGWRMRRVVLDKLEKTK